MTPPTRPASPASTLAKRLFESTGAMYWDMLSDMEKDIWRNDVATEALAWMREQWPTREEIARVIAVYDCRCRSVNGTHLATADALLALFTRKVSG